MTSIQTDPPRYGGRTAVEMQALCDAVAPAPWEAQYDRIFAPSEKGGVFTVADVRGWGYYTGNGHGGLGLPQAEAITRQDAVAAFIAASRSAIPEMLEEIAKVTGHYQGWDAHHH